MQHVVRVYWLFKEYVRVLAILANDSECSRTIFCLRFVRALWGAGLYSVISAEVLERAYFNVQAAVSLKLETIPKGEFESPSWVEHQKMLMAEHSVYMILDDIQYIVPKHGKTFGDYKNWNTTAHHGSFNYAHPIRHITKLIEAIESGGRKSIQKPSEEPDGYVAISGDSRNWGQW